jgi:Lon protease-like protein
VQIPLFPLHTVLFPGSVLPLHVFEQRYRQLVAESLDFGVVLIRQGREVGPGEGDDVYATGTLATLQEVRSLPDGRFYVVARGLERFRIQSFERGQPYLMARVEMLTDPTSPRRPRLLQLLDRYLDARGLELPAELRPTSPQQAVWLVGSLLPSEPLKRQRLLEAGDPELAEALLSDELTKLGSLGELGQVRSPRPSLN